MDQSCSFFIDFNNSDPEFFLFFKHITKFLSTASQVSVCAVNAWHFDRFGTFFYYSHHSHIAVWESLLFNSLSCWYISRHCLEICFFIQIKKEPSL